jgi:tyrosinase
VNVSTLTPSELAAFRHGVEVMKGRPATDPTSWSFQANIHGVFGGPPNPLFNQCEHGTIQFFTWHRAYLHFFERILRAASGDSNFMLPYWNWTAERALPVAFRDPLDPTNSLYDSTRMINDGSELPESIVVDDLDDALAMTDFHTPMWTGFSQRLEGSPHGAVHVMIGGNMGSVPTAANDPIFWMHHCNIDRVWDQWLNLNAGRANPADAAFLNQMYSFADETGTTVTVRVADIISSATLCYRYDDTPNPPAPTMGLTAKRNGGERGIVASSGSFERAVGAQGDESKPLGFRPERVALRVGPDKAPELRNAVARSASNTPGLVLLEIQGLDFATAPSFTYEVFLNLPEGASGAAAKAHRVGVVNFFVDRGHGHGGHVANAPTTFDQTLDATGAIARLRDAGRWDEQALSVTLAPLAPTAPAGKAEEQRRRLEESAAKAKITYKRVVLRAGG